MLSYRSVGVAALCVALAACGGSSKNDATTLASVAPTTATISAPTSSTAPTTTASASTTSLAPATTKPGSGISTIAGMPPVIDAKNLYSEIAVGKVSADIAAAKQYVYVPSTKTGKVTVIDQTTLKIVDEWQAGDLIQHVVPSHDLKTLYVNASGTSQLIPIDPMTGKRGKAINVDAPYNLYFTPDGHWAVVMAERRNRLDFYNPTTWKLEKSTKVACDGPNHADWSMDGSYFVVTCEFSGDMLKIDTLTGDVVGSVHMPKGAQPQDVRIVPDGSRFVVADMVSGGIWVLDGVNMKVGEFIATGKNAHGIYPSRDGTKLYISNRGEGSVSVLDATTLKEVAKWKIPGGGSPDMGGLNADGTLLWLSGRYSSEVYAFDTTTGEVKVRIRVPEGPHGLAVYPQPGRYSLGHTGNFR